MPSDILALPDPNSHQRFVGIALALCSTMLWSGNFIFAKFLAPYLTAEAMNFWRWLFVTAFMFPLGIREAIRHWAEIRSHLRLFVLYGVVGMCMANFMYYSAPATASAVNMVILAAVAPVFMMLWAFLLCGETITLRRLVGSCIALLGVATLVTKGHLGELAHMTLTPGDFWTLGGASCFAFYSVSLRFFTVKIPTPAFLLIVFAFATLASLPLFLYLSWGNLALPMRIDVLTGVFYISWVAAGIAFLCWNAAIARIGAVRAGIIYYLLPVFGAVEAIIFLGENISSAQVLGGCLVLGGVVFSSLPKRKAMPKGTF